MSQNLKELNELLNFAFDLQEAIVESLRDDRRVTRKDLSNFIQPGLSITAAFDGIGNPIARFRALDTAERGQLMASAAQRFDLPDDQLENLIEETLRELAGDIALIAKWQGYLKTADATTAA